MAIQWVVIGRRGLRTTSCSRAPVHTAASTKNPEGYPKRKAAAWHPSPDVLKPIAVAERALHFEEARAGFLVAWESAVKLCRPQQETAAVLSSLFEAR